ncbi:MAG: DegV family protein [Anaerolineae bacterium]|nr:DegV family protein [Anaerolineae bacterium]
MVNILTDSCADLGTELLVRYNIFSIPLTVVIAEKTYRDGIDINTAQLFEEVSRTGKLPKTSAPSVAEFTDFFKSIPGDHILITIGSKLSATYQNASLAAQEITDRKIRIIDSANLSTGIGLLAIKAAILRDQGKAIDEIEQRIKEMVPLVRTSFVIDTLEYLYMGGRCSAMQNIVGSLLKIRPVIEVRPDGTLGIKGKIRGSRQKALDYMLEDFRSNLAEIDLQHVFITHCMSEDYLYLRDGLLEIAPIGEILITQAGATISSHCGPNTIGILYMKKSQTEIA